MNGVMNGASLDGLIVSSIGKIPNMTVLPRKGWSYIIMIVHSMWEEVIIDLYMLNFLLAYESIQ